jgi:hypothetical protein
MSGPRPGKVSFEVLPRTGSLGPKEPFAKVCSRAERFSSTSLISPSEAANTPNYRCWTGSKNGAHEKSVASLPAVLRDGNEVRRTTAGTGQEVSPIERLAVPLHDDMLGQFGANGTHRRRRPLHARSHWMRVQHH